MFDRLLAAGAAMDWFTPALAFAQDWVNGPSVGFSVAMSAGMSAAAIRSILIQQGVKVWGMMLVDDQILFNTRTAQARYAAYLLQRNGIPFASSSRACVELGQNAARERNLSQRSDVSRRAAHQSGPGASPLVERALAGLERLMDGWI
jgi:hypothetical protein